jgi:hypothetical protein
MPARVQDVQQMDCHGQLCHSFGVWDENGKLAVNIGFVTREEADRAAESLPRLERAGVSC